MPRHIDPPMSIEERGLEPYLNETAKQHNGLSYKDFELRVRLQVPKRVIAEDFGVVVRTIYHWLKVFKKEVISQPPAD